MQNRFHSGIEAIFWLALFASPFLGSAIIAAFLCFSKTNLLWLVIIVLSIGAITGVLFAERTRRKYGCSNYIARLLSTPDMEPFNKEDTKKEDDPAH